MSYMSHFCIICANKVNIQNEEVILCKHSGGGHYYCKECLQNYVQAQALQHHKNNKEFDQETIKCAFTTCQTKFGIKHIRELTKDIPNLLKPKINNYDGYQTPKKQSSSNFEFDRQPRASVSHMQSNDWIDPAKTLQSQTASKPVH